MPDANASVFPEPVADPAITSSPARIKGIDFSCISLGLSNFSSFIDLKTGSLMPRFLKLSIIIFRKSVMLFLINLVNLYIETIKSYKHNFIKV